MRKLLPLAILLLLPGCGDDPSAATVPAQDAGTDLDGSDASETEPDSAVDTGGDVEADAGAGCMSGGADEQIARFETTYCEPLGAALCAAAQACGCGDLDGFPDASACEAAWRTWCLESVEMFRDAMAAGQLRYCEGPAKSCLEAVRNANEGCQPSVPAGTIPLGCVLMLSLNAREGEVCDAPGFGCNEGRGLCSPPDGICAPPPQGGEPCASVCAEGLVCGSDETCREGAAGDTCASGRDCSPPLACVGGTCATALNEQAGCSEDTECAAGLACRSGACSVVAEACADAWTCGDNAACVATRARACEPAAALGETCSYAEDCLAGAFCDGGTCAALPGSGAPCADGVLCAEGLACELASGTCGNVPGEGDPCALGVLGPFVCDAGLACLGDTCGAMPSEGQTCGAGTNACADGLGCEFKTDGTNVCVPRVGPGAACTNDSQCSAGSYCEFSTMLCRPVANTGESCEDGNECGPDGACVPASPGGNFVCAPTPSLGDLCFDACGEGLVCRPVANSGTCAAPICDAIAY
jgi:hypothetical protein